MPVSLFIAVSGEPRVTPGPFVEGLNKRVNFLDVHYVVPYFFSCYK